MTDRLQRSLSIKPSPLRLNPVKNSPTTLERKKIENDKLRDEWVGCCSRTDKHLIKFIAQVAMGSCVIIFGMIQIIRDVENKNVYFSMISGTLGIFLPRPAIGNDADDK
jgi:hypothetical protein